jgi:phosphoglycolate phosphatase
MMYHTLVFDLDGTLVDSLPGISHSFRTALHEVMPGRAMPDITPFIGPPIREIFSRALGGSVDSTELVALEAAFRVDYDRHGWRLTVPYPGVVETLEHLVRAGMECHILTNKPAHATGLILDHLGLSVLFRSVVTREIGTPHFPDKSAGARHLGRGLRPPAKGVLMVGDSVDDAEAAEAADFSFAAALYGFGNVSAKTSLRIDHSLSEFARILSIVNTTQHS